MDEFKKEINREISNLKSTLESKIKEMDSYILSFQQDLQNIIEAKKRERADFILEITSIFKKVEEVAIFKNDISKTMF